MHCSLHSHVPLRSFVHSLTHSRAHGKVIYVYEMTPSISYHLNPLCSHCTGRDRRTEALKHCGLDEPKIEKSWATRLTVRSSGHTHSVVRLLRSRAPLHSLICSLAHSLTPNLVGKCDHQIVKLSLHSCTGRFLRVRPFIFLPGERMRGSERGSEASGTDCGV